MNESPLQHPEFTNESIAWFAGISRNTLIITHIGHVRHTPTTMLPTRRQYEKWSLPSKWSFWAAVIGMPVGIVSLFIGFLPLFGKDTTAIERSRLVLQVAQELRYNDEWLSSLGDAAHKRSSSVPTGSLKTDALLLLVQREHDLVVRGAYGDEKYIYQHALQLRDLGSALGTPKSVDQLNRALSNSRYSLHDIHFLNNFLFWYIKPLVTETLSPAQLYSLGWSGLPGERFNIFSSTTLNMKHFVNDGRPITEYVDYLGLID